jgi:hypothetical protein
MCKGVASNEFASSTWSYKIDGIVVDFLSVAAILSVSVKAFDETRNWKEILTQTDDWTHP